MPLLALAQLLIVLSLAACARVGIPDGSSAGVVADDILYIATMDGEVWAVYVGPPEGGLEPGDKVWSFEIAGEPQDRAIYGTPAVVGDKLLVGGYDGSLYALSLNSGSEIRRVRVGEGARIVGGPVVVDDLLLIGSSDGSLYAFDIIIDEDGVEIDERWDLKTGNRVWSTPAVENGVAYFGSLDHSLYAVRVEDGKELWRFPTKGALTATPVVANGRVYVGSFDSTFYAVDAESGTEVARFEGAKGWYWAGPVATEETIYAASLDGNLYALDIGSLELKWTLEGDAPIVGSPVIVGGRIAVPSAQGKVGTVRLVNLDRGDSEEECSIGPKIKITASLAEHDGVVFLTSSDHAIRALRVKERGRPTDEWAHFTNGEEGSRPQRWEGAC